MTDHRRALALADLDRALAAMADHLLSGEELASLARMQAEAARLTRPEQALQPGLRDFDADRFQRLLQLAGPTMAGPLLTHLAEDLTRCRTQILNGSAHTADGPDWDGLRDGSHVLISLAGSVGALSLQAMSETLNAVAHGQGDAALDALIPALSGELDALIALVRATSVPTA